jgi:hypothetical protein
MTLTSPSTHINQCSSDPADQHPAENLEGELRKRLAFFVLLINPEHAKMQRTRSKQRYYPETTIDLSGGAP